MFLPMNWKKLNKRQKPSGYMETFLKQVAHDLYNKTEGNFTKVAIVFPNKRASLFFNEYLAQKAIVLSGHRLMSASANCSANHPTYRLPIR